MALVRDRRGAHHVARRDSGARVGATEPFVELGKRLDLARVLPRAADRFLEQLEAGEAIVRVVDEAGLAHLAVVDDVHAELGLPAHDVGHRAAHARGERAAS